jgi:hypothetical protein
LKEDSALKNRYNGALSSLWGTNEQNSGNITASAPSEGHQPFTTSSLELFEVLKHKLHCDVLWAC